jgi:hypothetical protein
MMSHFATAFLILLTFTACGQMSPKEFAAQSVNTHANPAVETESASSFAVTQGIDVVPTANSNCGDQVVARIYSSPAVIPTTPVIYEAMIKDHKSQQFNLPPGNYEVSLEGAYPCRGWKIVTVNHEQLTPFEMACSCQLYGKKNPKKDSRMPASLGEPATATATAKATAPSPTATPKKSVAKPKAKH